MPDAYQYFLTLTLIPQCELKSLHPASHPPPTAMVLRALTPSGCRLGVLVGEFLTSLCCDSLEFEHCSRVSARGKKGSRQFHRIVASSLAEDLPAAATAGSSGKRLFWMLLLNKCLVVGFVSVLNFCLHHLSSFRRSCPYKMAYYPPYKYLMPWAVLHRV